MPDSVDHDPTPRLSTLIATSRVVALRLDLVDLASKDVIVGLVLSQLLWAWRSTTERVHREGRVWLIRPGGCWWDECRITDRQARRALDALDDDGLIIVRRWKYQGVQRIHVSLVVEALESRLADHLSRYESSDPSLQKRTMYGYESASCMHGDESAESSIPIDVEEVVIEENRGVSRIVEAELVDDFDEFWRAWPRKVAKPTARNAWTRALKRATAEQITAGARDAAAAWQRAGTDPRFVPHPSTWLNRDGWDDDLTAVVAAKPSSRDVLLADLAKMEAAEANHGQA